MVYGLGGIPINQRFVHKDKTMATESQQTLRAFFASPFAEEHRWVREAIADACRQHNVTLRAVDEVVTLGTNIISAIHAEIDDCDFAFAVLTGNNPNVFYELGRLLQASKPTILLTRTDGMKSIPFDVRTNSILAYDQNSKDRSVLANAIGNAIGKMRMALNPLTRRRTPNTEVLAAAASSILAIDFEEMRREAERRLGKNGCKTIDITTHDSDVFKGWNQILDCPCGDQVIIIIDLNGEIKRVRTR